MHLGNGIICPVTGVPMLALAGVTAFYAYKKAKKEFTKDKILPAVSLTALVFGLQMINFAIPQTGSSGHIVGAILLAALLGPYTAFLAMCAILLVQAVFFADGGLMALGCNIFNMGFLACFVAYPLLYKPLAERKRMFSGALIASVAALQLGSIAVVAEGALSGSIAGRLGDFTLLMQGIHLPIGIIEGIVTGAFVIASRFVDSKKISVTAGSLAFILAGFVSLYASQKPDGLEWSLLNISDSIVMQTQNALYPIVEAVQTKSAILANMAQIPANLLGLFAVGILMFILSFAMTRETVKENAK